MVGRLHSVFFSPGKSEGKKCAALLLLKLLQRRSIFSASERMGSGASLLIQKPSALISHPQLWSLLCPFKRDRERREAKFRFQPTTQVPGYTSRNVYLSSLVHTHTHTRDVSWCCLWTLCSTTILVSNWVRNTFHVAKAYIYIGFITVFLSACFAPRLHNFLRGCTWQKAEILEDIRVQESALYLFSKPLRCAL